MDKKAKKILFGTYWSKGGWIDRKAVSIDQESFNYAKSKGYMFDPCTISHDECVERVVNNYAQISEKEIVSAFLSSLSSRRLDLRSSLSSYFIAKLFTLHAYEPVLSGTSYDSNGNITHQSTTCKVCRDYRYGIIGDQYYTNSDLNVLNFERFKWGGVRHGNLLYLYFDLNQFTNESPLTPTPQDILIFKEILQVIENCEATDSPNMLSTKLRGIASLKSNKQEIDILIEILAGIGVLTPTRFDRPIKIRNDWSFAEYWRGEDKYNREIVASLFGSYL